MESRPSEEALFTKYGSGGQFADAALSDGVVLKRSGPWASGVIALLRHLERVGFDGAPCVVGDGYAADGRLAVTFPARVHIHELDRSRRAGSVSYFGGCTPPRPPSPHPLTPGGRTCGSGTLMVTSG